MIKDLIIMNNQCQMMPLNEKVTFTRNLVETKNMIKIKYYNDLLYSEHAFSCNIITFESSDQTLQHKM